MECRITSNLNYLKIPEMIAAQRKAIYDKINDISSSHVVHKGLVRKENGTINIEQIPGIRETGWRIHAPSEEDLDTLQQILEEVMQKIKDHSSSWPFLYPVDPVEVPDYYEVIKDPIDLQSIENRLKAKNYYITKEIFLADLKRLCDNCRIYNREETEYYKCANDIQNEFLKRGKYFRRLESGSTTAATTSTTSTATNGETTEHA
jgi:histone acetyltransferase